jgi:ribosomal protein L24E
MYILLNWLFGWDYVQWSNSVTSGLARIHVDGNGRVFYWRYKTTKVADLIREPDQVLWLTCSPDKYLKIGDTKKE